MLCAVMFKCIQSDQNFMLAENLLTRIQCHLYYFVNPKSRSLCMFNENIITHARVRYKYYVRMQTIHTRGHSSTG